MFETTFNAIGIDAQAPNEEEIEAGAPPLVNLVVAAGLPLPFQNPQDGNPIIVPVGQYRWNLTKEIALQYAEAIVNAADKLPDTPKDSGLVIANNVEGARELLDQQAALRGDPSGKK